MTISSASASVSATSLLALSPLDGRYRTRLEALGECCGEYALIRARVTVEIAWLHTLAAEPGIVELPPLPPRAEDHLTRLVADFSLDDAVAVKAIEARTNHDVKAVEYWLRAACAEVPELHAARGFWHFACTSEDINNLAYAMMLRSARGQLLDALDAILARLADDAEKLATVPMLARTHGQAATPTTLGKELANFCWRLQRQRQLLAEVELLGKFNGAVGNYNAHRVAYPTLDWPDFNRRFVELLGFSFNPYTTQIESHDAISELCDTLARTNTILIDLCRDLWGYISLGYFRQKLNPDEVGSSTMPHKVNPIDFENAEGNLGIAHALFTHFSQKLPISRWQRDLTDSTVLRNLGVAFGHTLLAQQALLRGLEKLEAVPATMAADLEDNWAVLAEAIQTVMRRHGMADAYEQLKALTRGQKGIDRANLQSFITELPLSAAERKRLLMLTPAQYLGYAPELASAVRSGGAR